MSRVVLFLLFVAAAVVPSTTSEAAAAGSLDRFWALPAESTLARAAVILEKPAAFVAEVDSVLATQPPAASESWSRLADAARMHFEATRDSLLLSDVTFARGATPASVRRWYTGVQHDLRGAALRPKDPSASTREFRQAISAYHEAGHLRREAIAWGSLGVSLYGVGDRAAEEAAYHHALRLRMQLGDPVLIGRALNSLGSVHYNAGSLDSALVYFEAARTVREPLEDRNALAVTLAYIGNVYMDRGETDKAGQCYQRALDVAGPAASGAALLRARGGLANLRYEQGDYTAAAQLYRELIAWTESHGDDRSAALHHSNLGRTLSNLGDPEGALVEFHRARDIQEAEGDTLGLSETLLRTAETYRDLGDEAEALILARETRRFAEESEDTETAGYARLLEASLLHGSGHAGEALGIFREVAETARSGGNDRLLRDAIQQEAYLQGELENSKAALELYNEVLALDQEARASARVLSDRSNIGLHLTLLGDFKGGMAELRAAEAEARHLGLWLPLQWTTMNLGDTFERLGDLDSARVCYERAIDIMESAPRAALGEETKAEFLRLRSPAYEALVHVLGRLHERRPQADFAEAAFEVAERGKARALLDMLGAMQAGIDRRLAPEQEAKKTALDEALRDSQYRLRGLEDAPSPEPDSLRTLQAHLTDLEREQAAFLERLRLEDPRYRALDPGKPSSLGEVRETLLGEKRSLLLDFSVGDSASYVWAITRHRLTLHRLPPRAVISEAVTHLRAVLMSDAVRYRGRKVSGEAGDPAALAREAARLHEMILGPVRAELREARELYLVPDGPLHLLPFDLLLSATPPSQQTPPVGWPYEFAGIPLHYGPSVTTFVRLTEAERGREGSRMSQGCLVVADPAFHPDASDSLVLDSTKDDFLRVRSGLDPLPFTRMEAEAIHRRFAAQGCQVLLGQEAREKTLLAPGFLRKYRILHFATHGIVDELHPMRSRLALAYPEDSTEDGSLDAAEIASLDLDAELVVLSACETGKGKLVRGEGVLGLSRAFLYAGTPAVVVSLWNVSDEATALLMDAFYAEMLERGSSPALALARAKETLREKQFADAKPRFAHPYFWAGFVLVGVSTPHP